MGGGISNKSSREECLKKLPPLLNMRHTNNYTEGKETGVFSVAKINTVSQNAL